MSRQDVRLRHIRLRGYTVYPRDFIYIERAACLMSLDKGSVLIMMQLSGKQWPNCRCFRWFHETVACLYLCPTRVSSIFWEVWGIIREREQTIVFLDLKDKCINMLTLFT